MLKPEEKDILEKLHEANKKMTGICFALAMRKDDGSIKVYKRQEQPCYGELRKYKATHGEEATQPENRPGDLCHPFPAGTPEALAIGLPSWVNWRGNGIVSIMGDEEVKEFFDFLLSDASPFVRGFGSASNVEWTEDRKGFVLLDLEIDPTVLVNMLKHIQCNEGSPEQAGRFLRAKRAGLTDMQAFCLTYTVSHHYEILRPPYHYVYPTVVDLDRIVAQDPNDLTGGTLRNRFDYSRKRLHEIFYSKNGVNVFVEICKKAGKAISDRGVSMKEQDLFEYFVDVWNDHFNKVKKEKAA